MGGKQRLPTGRSHSSRVGGSGGEDHTGSFGESQAASHWRGVHVGGERMALAWWQRKVTIKKTRAGSSLDVLLQLTHYIDGKWRPTGVCDLLV